MGRGATAAIVGGTASVIGGGKFANGAATGAFVYAFNQAAEGRPQSSKQELNPACRGRSDCANFSRWQSPDGILAEQTGADSISQYTGSRSEWMAAGDLTYGIDVHAIFVGGSVSGGIRGTANLNSCFVVTVCGKIGLGLFVGAGGFTSGALQRGGGGAVWQGFVQGGKGASAGIAIGAGSNVIGGGRAFYGSGAGAAAGVQRCTDVIGGC